MLLKQDLIYCSGKQYKVFACNSFSVLLNIQQHLLKPSHRKKLFIINSFSRFYSQQLEEILRGKVKRVFSNNILYDH